MVRTRFEQKLFEIGSYSARNQIKVLLYTCVCLCTIICAVDPFELLPWRRAAFPSWWTADSTLQVSNDPICLKSVPTDREWRMLQVKVVKDLGHEHGVLDRGLLHTTWQMEGAAQPVLEAGTSDWACLKWQDQCLVSSPLEYWNHSESDLLSDRHLLETLSSAPSRLPTSSRLELPMEAALSDKKSGPGFSVYSANALVSSWLVNHPASPRVRKEHAKRNVVRDAYYKALSSATEELGQLQLGKGKPRQFVIKRRPAGTYYGPTIDRETGTIWALGYTFIALYIAYRLRRLDRVHSRFGLLLTAMVSMTGSGLLSLSVCKLLRFSVDSIPWKFIPLLISVLAADNAMLLTEAVISTSVEKSLPDRVGEGLAKVGPSILYALAVEHVLLLAGALLVPVRSVREMTLLAAVALKADAVMQVTLFLTILSIDIQRLELADLLRQGSTALHQQSAMLNRLYLSFPDEKSQWTVIMLQILSGCRERLARSVCFLAVIGGNLWLYARYGKQYFVPAFCSDLASVARPDSDLPPSRLWSMLNPASQTAIRVVVEAPILFWPHVFGGQPTPTSFIGLCIHLFTRFIKTVVAPVAIATLAVYLLLVYMLQDGDLLAAEKDRAAKEKLSRENAIKRHVGPRITGQVFDMPSEADVEALAVSNNGTVISWSLLDDGLNLTRFEALNKQTGSEPNTKRLDLKSVKTAIKHLAVNHDGRVCAVANAVGDVSVWSLADSEQLEFPPEDTTALRRSVIALFPDPRNGGGTPPKSGRGNEGRLVENAHFFALFSDGSLVTWDCAQRSVSTLVPRLEAEECKKVFAIMPPPSQHHSWPVLARFLNDEAQFWECRTRSEWSLGTRFALSQKEWPVTAASFCHLLFGQDRRKMVALGTEDGRVGLWDCESGELIAEVGAQLSAIRKIRLVPCSRSRCPCPAEVLCDAFLLIYSSDTQIRVKKCHLPVDPRLCLCPKITSRRSSSMTRSSSSISLKDSSSVISTEAASDYPLSPHAIRRVAQSNERRNREVSSDSHNSLTVSDPQWDRLQAPAEAQRNVSPGRLSEENLPQWAQDIKVVEFGDLKSDPNGLWELVGNYMLAGLRRPIVDQDRTEDWELFSVDLSNSKCNLDCITTSLTPSKSSSEDGSPKRRQNSPKKSQPRKLPFSRIRCWASTSDLQHLVVSYGSSIGLLSPTIGSKGVSPSNDALLAFLSNVTLGQKS